MQVKEENTKKGGVNWKSMVELNKSNTKLQGQGYERMYRLFALVRFERGDVITVQRRHQRYCPIPFGILTKDEQLKDLGGGLAIDAKDANVREGKANNAIGNEEGVVQAMCRILPGHEIYVDYRPDQKHPTQFLGAMLKKTREGVGRVTSFGGERNGNVVYIVKFSNGLVRKMSERELVSRLK
jgi:hypothetical protein